MSNVKIISYYTWGTPYEQEIDNLRQSCLEFGLDYHFESYPSRGSWLENVGIKPEYVLDCLNKFDKNLVFLDADAVVMQYPKLFEDLESDLAVHYRDGKELLSGTIFLANHTHTKELVEKWVRWQREFPETWDQKNLQKVIKHFAGPFGIKIFNLPASYTKIKDSMHGEPVIQHNQASRRYKRMIKRSELPGGIRQDSDGSLWIAKKNDELERWLDNRYKRVGNELRWAPNKNLVKTIDELSLSGNHVYLVGKGPSLDYLSSKHFQDSKAPVIAINESIHKVEELDLPNPVYCLQQDPGLRDTCRPKKATLIVSENVVNWYADYPNLYMYTTQQLVGSSSALSAISAIALVKRNGIRSFALVCFDAFVNGKTSYAEVVGYKSTHGGNPSRFVAQANTIKKKLHGYNVEYITPEPEPTPDQYNLPFRDDEKSSDDTPQESSSLFQTDL